MELLYHYLWKYKMHPGTMRLCDGREVVIKSPGLHNTASGPDFSHAMIIIDGMELAGNVEIHVKASDWYRHNHHTDPCYDNIVLHAVAIDDTRITRADGTEIPQLVIPVSTDLIELYSRLSSKIDDVKCLDRLAGIPRLKVADWLETLSMERLQMKASRILEFYRQFNSDWAQALFITLSRSLGFGLNGVPFEMLAKSLPLKYIFRHGDNRMQVEALLFGQAGMLDSSINIFDEYYQTLCREYSFLARKYGLRPLRPELWKTTTRPANSPQRRIAILSSALTTGFTLHDRLLECKGDVNALRQLFNWEAGAYWKEHSLFGLSGRMPTRFASGSITSLLINLAAPFYTAYASISGEYEWGEKSVSLLQSLPGEENSKTRQWKRAGIDYPDALRSQALIHLRSEYCDRGRCLQCRFGYTLLREAESGKPSFAMEPIVRNPQRKRKAVVAMDSWKGCLSAAEATSAAAEGLRSRGWECIEMPMADGGEGTASILAGASGAKRITVETEDPLSRKIDAEFYIDNATSTAYIDLASASGLTRLTTEERNPMLTSSYGTGLLIRAALKEGVRRIVLGLGGSATVDAGLGATAALGGSIYDLDGSQIEHPCGADLGNIGSIKPADISAELILLVDVDAPLTGDRGAARVFAPQKGADEAMTEALEKGMENVATLMKQPRTTPGYGAAGGAAAGLSEFIGGKIVNGAEWVADAIGLEQRIEGTDLVVTGEGSADRQTLMGKTPMQVMERARSRGVDTVIIAGQISDRLELMQGGFSDAIDINAPYRFHQDVDPMDPRIARSRIHTSMARAVRHHNAELKINE